MPKLITNKKYILQKYPGKGGWVYAAIDTIQMNTEKKSFGMVRVKGSIDDFPIAQYNLMPMGSGKLFLPVKKEIRKIICKKEGDAVHILLYEDSSPLKIPDELQVCLEEEPLAKINFYKLSESKQKEYVDWINKAKKMETKVNRIARTLTQVMKG